MTSDQISSFTQCMVFLKEVVSVSSCAIMILLTYVHTVHYIFEDVFSQALLEKGDFDTVCFLWGVTATCLITVISSYCAVGRFLHAVKSGLMEFDLDEAKAGVKDYIVTMTMGFMALFFGLKATKNLKLHYPHLIATFHLLPLVFHFMVMVGFVTDLAIFARRFTVFVRRLLAVNDGSTCKRRQFG